MTDVRVEHRSTRHDWQTPERVLEVVRAIGTIGLDPCTRPENPTGATHWVAPPQDGLSESWTGCGLVYCNPPYGGALPRWVAKCIEEAGRGAEIVLLVPSRTDTRWYHGAALSADLVCHWRGRIRFCGATASAPFPSAVFYWGMHVATARRALEPHGLVTMR